MRAYNYFFVPTLKLRYPVTLFQIGFHIAHDATIRQFLDQVDLAATGPPPSGTVAVIRAPRGPPEDGFDGGFVGWPRS